VIAERSTSVNRPFGVARTCRVLERPRSSVYWHREAPQRALTPRAKRGPKTAWSDEDLLLRIRTVLAESPFVGDRAERLVARQSEVDQMHLSEALGCARADRLNRAADAADSGVEDPVGQQSLTTSVGSRRHVIRK